MGGQSSRTSVHLAGPLSTDAERELDARLHEAGCPVFSIEPGPAARARPVDEGLATLRALAPPAGRAPDRTPP